MLKFRPLCEGDLTLMLHWLSQPHVKEWWNDGDDTIEKVISHYGNDDPDVRRFILVRADIDGNDEAIGYFQYYFADDETIDIDQFIGEAKLLGQDIGTEAIRCFIELIVKQHNPRFIIVDPVVENKRAIRCYEKIGFVPHQTIQDIQQATTLMMRFEIQSNENKSSEIFNEPI